MKLEKDVKKNNEIKEEVKDVNAKLNEITEEELSKVAGGYNTDLTDENHQYHQYNV